MKERIFISYSREDEAFVRELVTQLAEVAITGWMDAADITAGTAIKSVLRDAIKGAKAVIVLISRNAIASRWIDFEIGAAEAMGKRLIPVLISGEGIEPDIPEGLTDLPLLDARGKSPAQVAREIQKAVGD